MKMKHLFGTDGIRGRAGEGNMSPERLLAIGKAAAMVAAETSASPRVVIGKDTRLSGYMVESALVAGLVAKGANPILLGPLPTPAVSMLTNSLRADLGVMITASHNPYEDNGLKFFHSNGCKIPDETEAKIEQLVSVTSSGGQSTSRLGQASRLEASHGRYTEAVKQTVPKGLRFDGLRVVIDCANGAGYKVAPEVLWELGADVVTIGASPDGENINRSCGATDTRQLRSAVISEGADIGLALDGDADRIIICDERGQEIDGDQVLSVIAKAWKSQDRLSGSAVAATVMSNLGLERHLNKLGIKLFRTPVGDRHVIKCMRAENLNLGGEQSGHIVLSDYACTGDGLVAGLQVLSELVQSGLKASELCNTFEPLPQMLRNVQFETGSPLDCKAVKAAIVEAEETLANSGRLLIRKSGTEPLIRIMVEGEDRRQIAEITDTLADLVARAA